VKCKRRLRCDRLLKRRNSQGSCISVRLVAQAASCTLSDHPPCQYSPPPLATVEKQRMGSRWRKPGEPRKPKRMRPHNLQRPGFLPACGSLRGSAHPLAASRIFIAGLRTPGLLIIVLATLLIANAYPIARRQAASSSVDSFHCLAAPISSDDHVIMSGYHS
jgi:hypothetical protein